MMWLPRSHSTKRNGPVPINAASGGTAAGSRPSKTCSGTIGVSCEASAATRYGVGTESVSTAVRSSGVSITSMLLKVMRPRGWVSFSRAMLKATSREVNSRPSCHVTPGRRWNV